MLEVKASKRTGDQNYMSCIRACLADKYGDKPVGLGGTFLIEQGKAKLHIMVSNFKKDVYIWFGCSTVEILEV